MQEPELVAECIEAMTKSTKLPITIKTRIGYNDVEDIEFYYSRKKSFVKKIKPQRKFKYTSFKI